MPDDIDDVTVNDPFWSIVRRRHPDLDIVVLPPERPRRSVPGRPSDTTPERFEQAQLATADRMWAAMVGHGTPKRSAQWIPGVADGSVRLRVALALEGASNAAGIGHLRESTLLLTSDGWHVFAPPTGLPRVNADRRTSLGTEDLLLGFDPDTGRLFARFTSAELAVSTATACNLIGAA